MYKVWPMRNWTEVVVAVNFVWQSFLLIHSCCGTAEPSNPYFTPFCVIFDALASGWWRQLWRNLPHTAYMWCMFLCVCKTDQCRRTCSAAPPALLHDFTYHLEHVQSSAWLWRLKWNYCRWTYCYGVCNFPLSFIMSWRSTEEDVWL